MEPVRKPAKTLPPPTPAKAPPKAAQVPLSQAALLQSRIGAAGVGKLIAARSGGGKAPAATPGAPSRHASNDQAPQPKGPHAAKAKKDADGPPGKAREAVPEGEAPMAAGGEGKDASGVKLHMPEPPTKPSKATMDRIAGVQKRAGGAATAQGALPTADKQVADAQKAVTEPDAQRIAEARAQLIAEMHAAPSPEIEKLCTDIADAIRRRRPPDEDALDKAEPAKEAMEAGATLNSTVETQSKKVTDNYGPLDKPPEPVPGAPAPPLAPQPAAAPAAAPGAKAAVPDAVGADKLSLDKDAEEARKKVDDTGMNKPAAALVQSGPVAEAREAQGELDQTAKEDPAKIVAQQKEALAKANEDMGALQVRALAALTAHRAGTVGKTTQRQTAMVGTEAQMREQAGTQARAAFTSAKEDVQGLLKDLVPNAMNKWEAAKTDLTTTFKADLKGVADQVKKRHESTLAAIADYFTGLPDWATEGYDRAEKNFADGVIKKLREISTEVDAIIKACEARIKQARDEIAVIFNALPASLKEWATKEQAGFDTQLDKLGQEVHQTRDAFNKDLGQRAAQAVDEVRAEIAELRKKAGGLVGRIVDAVKRFVDDPVKFIIEGLLELLGISPPAFWAVVAKIKKVVRDIIDDPVNFANNLLKGIGQGFSQFFDNFPTHMIKGFLGWLLGDLKDVQVPKDFSLKSVITFFLQIMGITWPNIRKIIAKKIGEKNVALIEQVWSLVSILIDKGPEGIFEMIREKLDPQSILDQVIQMAVDYMVTAIVKAVAARLILLFNPAGAILQAIEAIYKVLKWVFENAARIFTLIETIVNGLADIIAGNVAGFANAVEKGLAMLIAPVLGFIADYLGFGDLPKAVAKQIKSFQKWILGIIEKAFDWLIEKGKALLAALGIGGKKDKDKKDDDKKDFDGKIGEVAHWAGPHESHEMWIAETTGGVEVMMASGQKGPVRAKLTKYENKAINLSKGPGSKEDIEDRQKRASDAIKSARQKLDATEQAAKATKAAIAKNDAKPDDVKAKDQQTEDWQEKLWPELQIIEIAIDDIPMPKTKIHGGSGQATTVTARPLSKDGSSGSKPRGKLRGWPLVAGRNPQWVAAHLLSEKLHGPGDPWNTTPMRTGDNTRMEIAVEDDAKTAVARGEVLYYTASVTYHDDSEDPRMNDFPASISVQWGAMRFRDKAWADEKEYKPYYANLKKPDLEDGARPDINELRRTALYKRNVPIRFAMAMDEERDLRGAFTDPGTFTARMTAFYKTKGGNPDDKLSEGVAAVLLLITEKKAKWPK